MHDYYEILQVHFNAEIEVIEAAYRRLARKYHPDVNKSFDAEKRMASINLAYEILKDQNKRAEYDRRRSQSKGYKEEARQQRYEESGEYHYRTSQKEYYSHTTTDQSNQTTKPNFSPAQPLPLIRFCTRMDEDLNPIDPRDVFSPDTKTILCCMDWQRNLTVGSEIKVVWYCNDKNVHRHRIIPGEEYSRIMSGIEYKIFFNSSIAGTNWEVYIFKDGDNAGMGSFRILGHSEYRQIQYLEGKRGSPNPDFIESLSEFFENFRRLV